MFMRIWNMPMGIMQISRKWICRRISYNSTALFWKRIRKCVSSRTTITKRKRWITRCLKVLSRAWYDWLFIVQHSLSTASVSPTSLLRTNASIRLHSRAVILTKRYKLSDLRALTPESTCINNCSCGCREVILIDLFRYGSFADFLFC